MMIKKKKYVYLKANIYKKINITINSLLFMMNTVIGRLYLIAVSNSMQENPKALSPYIATTGLSL